MPLMNIRSSYISILYLATLICCNSKTQKKHQGELKTTYPLNTWHLSDTLKSTLRPRFIHINSYQFDTCSLNDVYFDTSTILSIKIFPEKEAMILFGQKAKYGMIDVKTKNYIEFISNQEIYEKYSTEISSSIENTLFNIKQTFFSSDRRLYFDRNIVKEIKVNNDSIFWQDKWFSSIINMTLSK
jgi:hypothetical protein